MSSTSVLQRHLTLTELLDLSSFTEVCTSFVELYRVGLKVFSSDGTKLVDIKTGSGELCAYVFTRTPGKLACTETVTHIRNHALEPRSGHIESRDCFTGCRYVMTPILHEGDIIGRVVFGPFVPDDLPGGVGSALVQLGREGVFDFERTREYMGQIRQAPERTIHKVLDHFARIVDVLVYTSYRSTLTAQLHIETITENYRELQEKSKVLRESFERLKELDRLKSNFLATVSHELRTPLTSVIGYSEMLLAGIAGNLTDEQREYLETILEKGESLLNLITSILDLSQIEARGVRLNVQPTDVSQVVATALTSIAPQAQRRKITLTTSIDHALPKILIDKEKLRQCVVNLLSNAVKFSDENTRIHVRAGLAEAQGSDPFAHAGTFELSVSDEGPGIEESEISRIFDNFYQTDSSSTREHGGAGLGLGIVKSYVEAHEGTVRVESRLNHGSTFTISLPLRTGAPSASPDRVA